MESESDVAQGERGNRSRKHQTGGHELLCLGEADGKNHEQRGHENIRQIFSEAYVKDVRDGTQHQGRRETARHVKRDFAVRFEKTDESADDEQDDVNPESSILHGAQPASSALHVQAQNFARLAISKDFHRATADFAIGGEAVCSRAGVHNDFKALAAVGASDGF